MFATGGWQNANFVGGEVRDARRTLPRAILLGVAIVVVVYVAVNLAYLHSSNGDIRAARELLVKAREYIESNSEHWYVVGKLYILAQIAAVEGNNDLAIENFRKAVDAGWTKAWFGQIDPIMTDLRKDGRYMQILEELEDKLLEMREHPKVLASN